MVVGAIARNPVQCVVGPTCAASLPIITSAFPVALLSREQAREVRAAVVRRHRPALREGAAMSASAGSMDFAAGSVESARGSGCGGGGSRNLRGGSSPVVFGSFLAARGSRRVI
jgi:hypothetical protein